ncbi:MAG: VWA domain-containing protein [Anaerolineales bacterium]|nr:VWA domain-containing protein [Anaerolineales bacterium]
MKTLRLSITLLAVLALFGTAAFTPLAQAEENIRVTQVDTSQFPRVTVYVSATDAAGNPLPVDPNRIQLAENGQPIPLDRIEGIGDVGALTTMLVMDVSGSMDTAGKLDAAKAAAHQFIDRMRPGDQVGLIAFNTQIETVQPITSDQDALRAAVDSLTAGDDTAMYDALMAAVEQLEAESGRKAIIVLTDGMDNSSSANTDTVVNRIGPMGLSISAVGLGLPGQSGAMAGINQPRLQDLANRAGGLYGYAEDEDSLTTLYSSYATALQSEYAITYTSPATLRDGVNRALSVSLASSTSAAGSDTATQYNPGGLVPEVAQPASWAQFATVILILVALVAVPMLWGSLRSNLAPASGRGGGKVRLKKPANVRIKFK